MIRAEASPLLAPVRIALPPAGAPLEAVGELYAWLCAHGIQPGVGLDTVRGVLIDRSSLTVWPINASHAPGVTRPLTSHPSLRMLIDLAKASALTCTATYRHDIAQQGPDGELRHRQTAELWECNVPVDNRGRHLGRHADGRYGDGAWWDNDDPATAELFPPLYQREPFDAFLSRVLTDEARQPGALTTAPAAALPAPTLTRETIEAAIARLRNPAPAPPATTVQMWQYTPLPEPLAFPGDVPLLIAYDPARAEAFAVWQLDPVTGNYIKLGEQRADD